MGDPASASPKVRVVSIIDGSNLHVSLRARAQPTRLHYTRLSIEVAKRLPPDLRPWTFVRTFYVTSSPIVVLPLALSLAVLAVVIALVVLVVLVLLVVLTVLLLVLLLEDVVLVQLLLLLVLLRLFLLLAHWRRFPPKLSPVLDDR